MELIDKIKKYNDAYRSGNPIVSDEVYDNLVKQLSESDEFKNNVEPESFDRKQVKHPVPMLSTEKAYDIKELERFCNRLEKESGTPVLLRVTPKLDGLAARDDGIVFCTRGNGELGYEISDAFDKGVIVIGEKRGQGLGEIVIIKSYFEDHLSDLFAHPRNMVVGIVTSDNINVNAKQALEDNMVHFVPYTQLSKWEGTTQDFISNFEKIRNDLLNKIDYPNDGLIVEAIDEDLKSHMGATSHHYRWQIALKERGETARTTVNDIIWQVGRTGNITPVLIIEPVKLSGAMIGKVTAHHAGMIKELKIGKGSQIEIIRSGEVIPKLISVHSESDSIEFPTNCPSCNMPLSWNNDFLKCTSSTCKSKSVQKIVHWFKTLGTVDWFGKKSVEKMVDNDCDTLEKLYSLTEADFMSMGFGEIQSKNFKKSLDSSRSISVDDWRFLAGFGISNLGKGDSKKLLSHISLENLIKVTPYDIQKISGFGEKTSQMICDGFKEIYETFKHMISLGFNLKRTLLQTEIENVESSISGKYIVFTGKMTLGKRDDMKDNAAKLGAIVQSSVNKKTDILVCGEKVGKKKTDTAKKLGTMVISEFGYYELLKE